MTPTLARFAADLDTARANSRALTAQWTELVAAYRAGREPAQATRQRGELTVPTHTSETITRTIRRWIVPAAEPWGACIGDISAASADACRAYRDAHGLPEGTGLPDDALRFHIGDDEIVISFETEEPTP